MSDEQRRALADTTPTTEVIRDAVTFPRDRLGEPLDISPDRFDAWLAAEVRAAKAEALDEFIAWAKSLNDKHPRFRVANDLAAGMAKRFKADNYSEYETGDQA